MAKIALLLGPGFDHAEFESLYSTFKANGHRVTLVGPKGHPRLEGIGIQAAPDEISPSYFDAVVVPGGTEFGALVEDAGLLDFVRRSGDGQRVLAAIGQGTALLFAAGCVEGKKVTGPADLHDQALEAQVNWFSQEDKVVEDGSLVTARGVESTDPFARTILRKLPLAGS